MSNVSKTELGKILGKSQPTLTTWAKQGMPIEAVSVRGKAQVYDTAKVIDWMLKREKDKYLSTPDSVLDVTEQNARLLFHRANNEAMKEQERSGELIPAEAVMLGWHDHVFAVRARLLALPTKIAPEVLHLSTLREIESAARELVYEALDELAGLGGMPPGFFERIEKLQTEIPDFPARILAALEQCSNG